ncbi:MAG: histidine phosphatase family protein [Leptolyngbyaceae cyanobacterium SL_5_9]|nr:histidine phosphatase family protein [Leptolyngbyaceae cyanobacterium SL_5_9]NJO76780.1 histidine phosphatase family protein [Leptolyngbyaceae cyanobacterium RM1_406_9]
MKLIKLLFIRHAQSVGNRQKRMQGHRDFGLSTEGIEQAKKLAQRLVLEHKRPNYIYSSPLKRAAQTAEILLTYALSAASTAASSTPVSNISNSASSASATTSSSTQTQDALPKLQVEYADELKEFQNGIFEGLTWAEAKQRYPALCDALEASPDWIQIPGAESLQDARDRARRFIQTLLTRHTEDTQIWIVTHSWILQHLIAELLGSDRSWRLHAHNTAIFEFWLDRSRWDHTNQNRLNTDLWQIRRFNDYRHLG